MAGLQTAQCLPISNTQRVSKNLLILDPSTQNMNRMFEQANADARNQIKVPSMTRPRKATSSTQLVSENLYQDKDHYRPSF